MIKTTSFALALVSVVSLSVGCSSSSTAGSSGGSNTAGCVQGTTADMDVSCIVAKIADSTSAEVDEANSNCTKNGGKVVTECPTAGLVGCCTTTIEGSDTGEACSYSGTAAEGESQCKQESGMWSTSP